MPSSTGPRPARRNVSHLGSISPSPGTRPGRLGKSLVRKHSWSWESQSQFYPLLTMWRQTCHQWECTLRLNESDFSPHVKWTQCYYGCCENRMRWFYMKRSDFHNSDSLPWTARFLTSCSLIRPPFPSLYLKITSFWRPLSALLSLHSKQSASRPPGWWFTLMD